MKEEEKNREESGIYDSDMDSDDDETKELLVQAEKIKEKEDLMRMESRFKKGVDKPKLSRKIGRKRERTMDRFEQEFADLGVNIRSKKMRHLNEEQEREQTGKKIRVGRSPSVHAQQALPRNVQGIPDQEVIFKFCRLILRHIKFRLSASSGPIYLVACAKLK